LHQELPLPDRTPLYHWHLAKGARMVDFAGWEMPIQYTSIIDEHVAVRTSSGLFDISHMGRLQFTGAKAQGLLESLYTNEVASMKIGQARYGLVCNESGGILDDVLVYRFASFWLMVVNASNREKLLSWISSHDQGSAAGLHDRTHEWAMLAVQGPHAVQIVRTIYPGADSLKYYFADLRTASDGPVIVSRTGYTGEDGFELIVPSTRAESVVQQLLETASKLGKELQPCGLGARDTLRLEAAMPLYGHELNESIDPFQAGLHWAVKLEKGEFIGRSALRQRRQDPSLRRRVGLELSGKRIAREGSTVLDAGKNIGSVTSGTFAPYLQKVLAMAYVDQTKTSPGAACQVEIRGKPESARVVPLPFYRRSPT
jgi:aminomethyltransferase